MPAHFIAAQIDAVFSDLEVNAVKIGMLSVPVAIAAVAAGLERWKQTLVVLDPVMVATSGDRLLAPAAIEVLKRELIPRALVDHAEPARGGGAARRAGRARTKTRCARRPSGCSRIGAKAVLIKGGHAQGAEAVDLLVDADARSRGSRRRRSTPRTRTAPAARCPSAIAAGLAKGQRLSRSRGRREEPTSPRAIAAADELDDRHGPRPDASFSRLVVGAQA